ncbi:MAG TPA: D-glycero-beta-D-manno-heptose 1-phosphate adenylyltransferase [Desulfobacterales bacterium]|nr:D-glycero-beta-D-manno-heptose 1-phosphate adenylyltransferase [Desulfobacterales bacterium]
MNIRSKVVNLDDLLKKVADHRKNGEKIVFTNGCFDILHVGHVRYLAAARNKGDILVVGLNSDRSTRKIKGEQRPIVQQGQRAEILASLCFVDYITIFNEQNPLALIRSIRPDILVKGDDWPEKEIVGGDIVKADGGEVVRVPVVPNISTASILKRIINGSGE